MAISTIKKLSTEINISAFAYDTNIVSWSMFATRIDSCGPMHVLYIGFTLRNASSDWVTIGSISDNRFKPKFDVRSSASAEGNNIARPCIIRDTGDVQIYKPSADTYFAELVWITE